MNILQFKDVIQTQCIQGKRVFIRSDLNVPLNENGEITEDTRIRASLECIKMAIDAGAAVMVASHLGRPSEGQSKPQDTLLPVAKKLTDYLNQNVSLISNWVDKPFEIKVGEVVLLENCRLNYGEKANSDDLAKKMANLCDIFVHDAFGTAHRAEASTHGIAKYVKVACAGPLLSKELDALSRALSIPKKPLLSIVAGSKVSTKLSILNSLADKVDQLIVGGGIANTFMLASGLNIGKSLAEPDLVDEAKKIIAKMQARGASVPIPVDVVVAKTFEEHAIATIKAVENIKDDDLILDIGPNTAHILQNQIKQAETIVWNGPMGVFEWESFSYGTQSIALAIAKSSAFSIAGGGDTLAAIAKYNIEKDVSYISTGGGAFLEFLEGTHLPIFDVLHNVTQIIHA